MKLDDPDTLQRVLSLVAGGASEAGALRAVGVSHWELTYLKQRRPEVRHQVAAARSAAPPPPPIIVSGQVFGLLTAVHPSLPTRYGARRWHFECACGASLCWRVSSVVWNLKHLGWASCKSCFWKLRGGWRGAQAKTAPQPPASGVELARRAG